MLRCDRVDFPPGGVAYRHTHPGPGLRVLLAGTDPDRHAGRVARVRPARVVVRDRPRSRLRRRLRDGGDGVRPRAGAAGRVGGEADDHVRRSGRRGQAEAAASADLSRAAAVSRHGGKLLVDQLAVHGVDTVFCVPGRELPAGARRALRLADPADHVPPRGRAPRTWPTRTGSSPAGPGVAIVTRGPGATQAAVGVHTAFQDSTPLILLVGQVGRDMVEPRGVPGGRLPRACSAARQVGRADRPRRAHAGVRRRAPSRPPCPDGPGRSCSRCPRTCSTDEADVADAQPFAPSCRRTPARTDLARLRDAARAARSGRS